MVPGARPKQKAQKGASMAQQPPRTPIRITRQSAAMPSPGGRPPPKQRQPLPPKNISKPSPKRKAVASATQLQGNQATTGSQTTETTLTLPTTPNTTSPALSAPLPNTQPSPTKYTKLTAARSTPGANPFYFLPRVPPPTTTSANQSVSANTTSANQSVPTPTPTTTHDLATTTSGNQSLRAETSPGARSSRQSNDINESADLLEAANSEGHTNDVEPDEDLVQGTLTSKLSFLHPISTLVAVLTTLIYILKHNLMMT